MDKKKIIRIVLNILKYILTAVAGYAGGEAIL